MFFTDADEGLERGFVQNFSVHERAQDLLLQNKGNGIEVAWVIDQNRVDIVLPEISEVSFNLISKG